MSAGDCGYGVNVAFAPGGRFAVLCTMDGFVKLVDSASGTVVMSEQAHETRPVYGLAVRSDGKGFMTGAGDKFVKFWDFKVMGNSLSAGLSRQLQMSTDVLSLCYSPARQSDKLLVAVGLLDGTVQLLYDDSLRFFLSLYGHKLPVLCLDVSYDSQIIVSGSADKTIKIWGLDFGDCHRYTYNNNHNNNNNN